jgi:L-ribulose-5-phosphate 4-epimerase
MSDEVRLWQRLMHASNPGSGTISNDSSLRNEICKIGKEMDQSGLALFLGVYAPGNLSARLPGSSRILVTPSGLPKGSLKPDDLVVVDLHGGKIEGRLRPSIETPMHCSIYRRREDVNGIIHTHSPMCMAYAITNKEIQATTIELAGVSGGRVPVARYVTPATEELGEVTVEALGFSNAVIMQSHGLVSVGGTLRDAFNNALAVEYTAMVNIYGKIVGDLVELPPEEVCGIRRFVLEKYGQRRPDARWSS